MSQKNNFQVNKGLDVNGITVIDSNANGTFNIITANTLSVSGVDVTYISTTANAAFTQANTATTIAGAAFTKANNSIQSVSGTTGRITSSTTGNTVIMDLSAIAGLSAGTYTYPQLQVDSYGRIATISNQTPVTSWNGMTGAITLSSANVTSALGYTPATSTLTQAAFDSGNTTLVYAQSAYSKANADGVLAQAAFDSGNTTLVYAQSAYSAANGKFSSTGGTISGDTVVTGNLTVTGTRFYANTVNLVVEDNIITINSNVTGTPTLNAGIEVNRGTSTNTSLLWNETDKAWEFTNDGTNYEKIVTGSFANASYSQANTSASAITVLQSVNTTQNTNISTVTTNAQASFDYANTVNTYATSGYGKANSANVLAQSAYTQANTGTTLAQAAFNSGNTTLTYAQAGYAQANTGTTLAQAAFNVANTSGNGNYTFSGNTITLTANATGNLAVSESVTGLTTKTINQDPSGNYSLNTMDYSSIVTSTKTITIYTGYMSNGTLFQNDLTSLSIGASITIGYGGTHYGAAQYTTTVTLASVPTYSSGTFATTLVFNESITTGSTTQLNSIQYNVLAITNNPRYYEFGKDSTLSIKKNGNTSSISATTLVIDGTNIPVKLQSAFDKANTDVTSISTTAGVYGGSTAIPVITLSANGRVSSITNTSITTGTTITDETTSASTYYPVLTTSTSGSIGVANTSSSKLSFVPSTGTLTAVDINTTSDAQYKENIETIPSPLNIINSINGVSFNWKDTGNKTYGVIAQELQQVLPELVKRGDQGLSVSYLPLIAILIEAVKEQQKQIDELKK